MKISKAENHFSTTEINGLSKRTVLIFQLGFTLNLPRRGLYRVIFFLSWSFTSYFVSFAHNYHYYDFAYKPPISIRAFSLSQCFKRLDASV